MKLILFSILSVLAIASLWAVEDVPYAEEATINYTWHSYDSVGNVYYTIDDKSTIYKMDYRNGSYRSPAAFATGRRPVISYQGDYLLFDQAGKLYVTFKKKYADAWHQRELLPSVVNGTGNAICAGLSTDGHYLYYTDDLTNVKFKYIDIEVLEDVNRPPYKIANLKDTTVMWKKDFSFAPNRMALVDDNDEALVYSARLQNGDPLPSGLSIDASTGIISGRRDALGDYQVAISVTDREGKSVTSVFNLKIVSALALDGVEDSWLTCFPNPVESKLYLSHAEGVVSYRISSLSGQVLLAGVSIPSGIHVASLSSGLYLIDLWTSDNLHSQQRFIKK